MADIYVGQPQRTRALGGMALRQGMQGGPVYHPLQALGQLAQTAAGVYLSNKADQQEQQRREQAQSALMGLLQPAAGGTQTAMAGGTAMPADVGSYPNLAALVTHTSQYPEHAGVLNPMIAAQFKPQKPLVLGEGDVAFDPKTRQEIARGPEAAPKFTTDYGKAVSDARLAEKIYGKDSPQAAAFREIAQAERSGVDEIDLSDEAGQRKEFGKASANYISVRESYENIRDTAPTAAGDMALIFSYMKMLDPNSTVREGEYATAEQARGVPATVRAMYNRAIDGVRLAPEQREDFKGRAADIFETQRKRQDEREGEFRALAKRSGLRPDNVVLDYQGDLRAPAPYAPTQEDLNADLNAMTNEELKAYLERMGGG